MCGRINVSDDPFVMELLGNMGLENPRETIRLNRFIRATNVVSIVREKNKKRELTDASWWLLQEPTEKGFKPSKYTSFNTRYDKLNVMRGAGYTAYRESRCILVAKGFGETQGKGSNIRYHDFYADQGAIVLGGLYREWHHPKTGQNILSCSVITLAPHEKLLPYHSKASPLMLPQDDGTIDAWLDPFNSNIDMFNDLLVPRIRQDLMVQEINKPSLFQGIGQPKAIAKD